MFKRTLPLIPLLLLAPVWAADSPEQDCDTDITTDELRAALALLGLETREPAAGTFGACVSLSPTLPVCLSCCNSANLICRQNCQAQGESDPQGCLDGCAQDLQECSAECYWYCTFGLCS